jgi:hypothetical protein
MKLIYTIRTLRARWPALALALPVLGAMAQGAPQVLEGRLTEVQATFVQLDHQYRFAFVPADAKCFDFRGDAMTCETLVGIGYADRARVTISGNEVQRIDILELQQ